MNSNQVIEYLRKIEDPELKRDIVSLGMIREIRSEDGYIHVHYELAQNTEAMRAYLEQKTKALLKPLKEVKEVTVEFSRVCSGTPAFVSNPENPEWAVQEVIAVASGKGGVGKTTVAVNLALALHQQGFRVGLMDADIYGPNVPLMLGIDPNAKPGFSSAQQILPVEIHGIKVISMGVLVPADQPMVWRGPKLHGVISQFVNQVAWGELDYLLVDMPPGTGDVQLSLVQNTSLSGAVIVTTPQEVALMDVRKGIVMFQKTNVPILGVIENMTGEIFGKGGGEKAAKQYGVPYLGEIPLEGAIRQGGDRGEPIVLKAPESPAGRAFLTAAKLLNDSFKRNR